jgi:hypothetical protein
MVISRLSSASWCPLHAIIFLAEICYAYFPSLSILHDYDISFPPTRFIQSRIVHFSILVYLETTHDANISHVAELFYIALVY